MVDVSESSNYFLFGFVILDSLSSLKFNPASEVYGFVGKTVWFSSKDNVKNQKNVLVSLTQSFLFSILRRMKWFNFELNDFKRYFKGRRSLAVEVGVSVCINIEFIGRHSM